MNTMTRRWVGAPKERAAVSFHDAVVDFCRSMSVEDSDSRRFELTFGLSFSQGVSKQNRKSKIKIEMNTNRALIGAGFKHVPLRFVCSEKINDFQPIAKIKKS